MIYGEELVMLKGEDCRLYRRRVVDGDDWMKNKLNAERMPTYTGM